MDALLLQEGYFLLLPCQSVELEHFDERVTVLGSELYCKLKVVLCLGVIEVFVCGVVGHCQARSLTPNFARLWNLLKGLVEGVINLVVVLVSLGPGMLQLD